MARPFTISGRIPWSKAPEGDDSSLLWRLASLAEKLHQVDDSRVWRISGETLTMAWPYPSWKHRWRVFSIARAGAIEVARRRDQYCLTWKLNTGLGFWWATMLLAFGVFVNGLQRDPTMWFFVVSWVLVVPLQFSWLNARAGKCIREQWYRTQQQVHDTS